MLTKQRARRVPCAVANKTSFVANRAIPLLIVFSLIVGFFAPTQGNSQRPAAGQSVQLFECDQRLAGKGAHEVSAHLHFR